MDINKDSVEKIDETTELNEVLKSEEIKYEKPQMKTKRKMSTFSKTVVALSVIVFAICVSVIVNETMKHRKNIQMNTELESVFEDETNEELPFNFDEMVEINPGFVGWITVPNTSISLPVVKYVDNSYYLKHNFYKEYDRRGTVFMDYRNSTEEFDANTILYGHNCYDGTMFSELEKYQETDFYKTSPVIEFDTKNGRNKWKIYGVFITSAKADEDNGYVFNYIYPYMDGENFEGFINEINKRRLYETDVDITDEDNMLILSTCIRKLDINKKGNNYRADARLVVVSRKVRPGESEEVNTENVKLNPSPKYPQLWYDKNGIKNPYANDEKWYPLEVNK